MRTKIEPLPLLNGERNYRVYYKRYFLFPWALAPYKDFRTRWEAVQFSNRITGKYKSR